MNIEMDDLLSFVTAAVDAGVQRYMKSVEPDADWVKLSEAKRYVKRLGYKPVMVQRWTDARLLTPIKTGERQNSSVRYSLADIKTLISSLKLKIITNKTENDRDF